MIDSTRTVHLQTASRHRFVVDKQNQTIQANNSLAKAKAWMNDLSRFTGGASAQPAFASQPGLLYA